MVICEKLLVNFIYNSIMIDTNFMTCPDILLIANDAANLRRLSSTTQQSALNKKSALNRQSSSGSGWIAPVTHMKSGLTKVSMAPKKTKVNVMLLLVVLLYLFTLPLGGQTRRTKHVSQWSEFWIS